MINELILRRGLMMGAQGGSILPSGYTQYDWVQSVENTAIDTQYLCEFPLNTKQHRYRLEGKFARSATADTWPYKYILFGGAANNGITMRGDGDNISVTYNCAYNYSLNVANIATFGTWHTFTLTHKTADNELGGLLIIDGVENNISGRDGVATTGNLLIFGNGTAKTSYPCRFAELKVYEYDVLVADLVPCKRDADDVVGLYDVIRNIFLTTTGSAVLTCGDGFENFNT